MLKAAVIILVIVYCIWL